ncbi:LCP family protein [Mycobacterium sp. HUMS_1102779]|uniref:LCP family protein n=1 Tax=Mycobacterium sp. HUMS_1102779 TaxID=3383487 RepID=UPI00389A08F5
MSDGGADATPDGRRVAPWERFSEPAPDHNLHRWQPASPAPPPVEHVEADSEDEHEDEDEHEHEDEDDQGDGGRSGSHTRGGITVADLIAKFGAPPSDRRRRHRAADDAKETEAPDTAAPEVSIDQQDTQVIATPAYWLELRSEVPDLRVANYPHGEDPAVEAPPAKTPRRLLRRRRREPKPRPGRRRLLFAVRSLAALLAVLSLAMTGGAWQWATSKNSRLNTVSALDPHSRDIVDPGGQYGDEDFLIVGMDSRLGDNANMGAGDADDAGGARSDTVMLVNIPANRKRVVVVSFPRDLAITPIQCEVWNPETGKYGPIYDDKTGTWSPRVVYTETKLNSTFSFGGPKCLVKEIQKLSGLSINRFIAVDFSGFAKMVEALGGVEVCTSAPLHDYELGTVLKHAGRQIIDGPTALNYVRARQVTTENNGDYGRIKRQQRFVSSLLRSLISEDTLLDLNKLNNVVNLFIGDSYVDNVKTKDLVQLGQSLQGIAAGHITFVTVPTGVTDENGDEPPRTADMRALFDAIIDDDPLPLENDHNAQRLGASSASGSTTTSTPTSAPAKTPAPSPEVRREQVTTASPHDVTVRVSNATAKSGLAAAATTQLERDGFNVMTPDDYPSALKATTVFFSPGNEHAAATVAAAFANSKVHRVSGYGQVVQVVLGPDFSAVADPPPGGSPVSVQIERNSGDTPAKLPEDLTVTNAADTTCE